MIFRQLFEPISCTYTYLLACEKTKEALFIDPVKEHVESYLRLAHELDLKLILSLDTHLHADHVTGAGDLEEKTGCKIVMGDRTKAKGVSLKLKDKEEISFGNHKLQCLYTPGHTDDSFSFLLEDRVFTGDTLLIRGTGRCDFQNGSAEDQFDSLFGKLLLLPEETKVFPAHDYKGWTMSSIGEEKRFNPRLQVSSRKEYKELMDNLNLPKPKYMHIAVPANLNCGKTV